MSCMISPGVYALILLLVAGVWLAVSPWAMETQVAGAVWRSGTINNLVVGDYPDRCHTPE